MKTTANAVSLAQRPDLARIASWIEPSTHVLDLGCADGKLLAYLQRTKNVHGSGIERDPEAVVASGVVGCRSYSKTSKRGWPYLKINTLIRWCFLKPCSP